jgi:TorA maturation chaperone TorD
MLFGVGWWLKRLNNGRISLMNNGWAEQLIAHQLAYSFLSKATYEAPEAAFIRVLAEQALFSDWPMNAEEPTTQTGLNLLRAFCDGWDDTQLAALKHDYARLFVGPDALLAPPWESVYRSVERLIFEKQTLEVRQEYQRFGMPIPKLHIEPEDHFGLELRFIAYLCSAGLNALEHNEDEQLQLIEGEIQAFLNDHILQWADAFLDNMQQHAETDYYRGIAHLTRGTLAQTARVFSAQPQETVG